MTMYVDCDDVADTSICCILLDDSESVVEVIDDLQTAHQVSSSNKCLVRT